MRYSASEYSVALGYRLFKVIENGTIQLNISDFLLVRHCKYSSILYSFWVIIIIIIIITDLYSTFRSEDTEAYTYLKWSNIMTVKSRLHRSLKVSPTFTIRKLDAVSYSSSIVSVAVSWIILEIKRDIGKKNRDFFYTPLAFDAPVRGCPSDYCLSVWCGKSRMMCLPDGEKKPDMFTRFDRMHEHDRQTDWQTPHDG